MMLAKLHACWIINLLLITTSAQDIRTNPNIITQKVNMSAPYMSNIKCISGFTCVDVDMTQVLLLTNTPDKSLTFGRCTLDQVRRNTINDTHTQLCIPWSDNTTVSTKGLIDRGCGQIGTVTDLSMYPDPIEPHGETKYILYTVDAVLDSRLRNDDGTFSDIITVDQPVYVQPLQCRYHSRGYLLATEKWRYIPTASQLEKPYKGAGNFSMQFFLSSTKSCQNEVGKANPDGSSTKLTPNTKLHMCFIVTNLTDPSVKVTVRKIWATPTSNPQNPINTKLYDGNCFFEDTNHAGTTVNGHNPDEIIMASVSIGLPKLFPGSLTMSYHADVTLCMTASECPTACSSLRTRNTPALGRSRLLNDLKPTAGLFGQEAKSNVTDIRLSPLALFTFLLENKLPVDTDLRSMYRYIDTRIEQIQKETKRRGSAINVDQAAIIREYRDILAARKSPTGSIFEDLADTSVVRKRRSLEQHELSPMIATSDYEETSRLFTFGPIIFTNRSRKRGSKALEMLSVGIVGVAVIICAVILTAVMYWKKGTWEKPDTN